MKKILVLVGGRANSGRRFAARLSEYSPAVCTVREYAEVCVVIRQNSVTVQFTDGGDIADYDLVYLRGISEAPLRHVLAAYLRSKQTAVVNSESFTFQATTKLEQYVLFALAGVPVPDSVYIVGAHGYELAPALLQAEFPLVAKSISGSNGADNVIVDSAATLTNIEVPNPIFQAFIPNDFDYRVIVAGDQVICAYKRVRSADADNHRNNVSQGGVRVMVDLPNHLCELAISAASAIGREFTGVDILTNSQTGTSVVLEANFNFGTPVFDNAQAEAAYYEAIYGYFVSLVETS